ncbi:MAG: ABC transporter permease [Balneolaceae bacterium]|nr:ABC transporter permease [Balneolaceae bacterium]MBO6545485.1 ABC transporter permease [Balneolaceae bacterium]MBO6646881.1 ABC transporter permease [Balneolaceae bacterium]
MNNRPPKIAEKLLSKLLYDDVWKTTLGDFEEQYSYLLDKEGKSKANRWYWGQILRYAPSKITHKLYWSAGMFKNYLKIAYRSILKNKSYSFINISGLAVGLASFLLIGIYINHELSYDTFHEDSDRIYRIIREAPEENYMGSSWFGVNPMPLTIALGDNFDGVEAAASFSESEALLKVETNSFYEQGINTDLDFFEMFTLEWISGDVSSAFKNPESVIITQSLAAKYFGSANPMGKDIFFDSDDDEPVFRTVTGVIADIPSNSQLVFDFIVPSYSLDNYERASTYWMNNNEYSYIKISPGIKPESLVPQISELVHAQLVLDSYYANNPQNLPNFKLVPIADVHLKSTNINFNPGKLGDIKYIYMLSAIAFVILIIACVNYMNLATARSMSRAKEVGVRKVNGAFRSNIMMQFSAEAVLFSMIGIVLAFAIVFIMLPSFSVLVDRTFNPNLLLKPLFWAVLIGTGLIVGLIAGSYPAFFMSALKPIGIFKSQVKGGTGSRKLRNALVVGQFAITNILIIGSIVIFQQLNFIKSSDSGYDRDQVLAVTINDPKLMQSYDALSQRLASNSNILAVSSGRYLPNDIRSQTSGVNWDGKAEDEIFRVYNGGVSAGYIELFGINMIAGNTFNKNAPDTALNMIVNETFVHRIGWTPEEAVGKDFTLWRNEGKIVGVAEDFNFLSYHSTITPLLLRQQTPRNHQYLILKVSPANLQQTIAFVEEEVTALGPDYPFQYAFLDDVFNNMYRNELTLGKILNYFTILGLIIACMGLFGLAAFMMEQRTKEIGIRKVLGADIFQIVTLLNKDFLKLIAISFTISLPLGWFLANNWLESFAYKITVGPLVFIVTAAIAFGIAILTVSYKSIRTATANPVDSLKSE